MNVTTAIGQLTAYAEDRETWLGKRKNWQGLEKLGEGGQSTVYLVRHPDRETERKRCLDEIGPAKDAFQFEKFAHAIHTYTRADLPSELGALKEFKIPPKTPDSLDPHPGSKDAEAVERLRNEIDALKRDLPGLPKLLAYNIDERWMVTEFFPNRSLEHSPLKYRGNVYGALRAFRSLVKTVAGLHAEGMVHRDIKPPNVFIRTDLELVLGDFGIVYFPSEARVTLTGEKVGPRDYMPQWAHLGERNEDVQPNIDVYMLGKLLWSMVDGRPFLPREYHHERKFDLTKTFPYDPHMHLINQLLDECVTEKPNPSFPEASGVLIVVDKFLKIIEGGGQLLNDGVPRHCHVCGVGTYELQKGPKSETKAIIRFWYSGGVHLEGSFRGEVYICNGCGNVQMFSN